MKRSIIYLGIVLFCLSSFSFAKDDIRDLFKNNSAIIYTINIRNFASFDGDLNGIIEPQKGDKIGTFLSAKDKLEDLKKDGINTIYLLPITKNGKLKALGTAGSLYAMDSFNEVAPELDEIDNNKTVFEEAKEFVEYAHKLGLNVIVDLPSCASYDMTLRKPDRFISDKNKEALIPADWTDVRLLKVYDDDKNLNNQTLENFKSFVDMAQNIGFDGIRADVAAIKPPQFWKEIIKYARIKNKNFLFLAEANPQWDNPAPNGVKKYSSVPELLNVGFDSYYAPWSDFKNIKTKEEFDNKIMINSDILKKYKNKSSVSTFATHDQQAPILRGENYWNMVLWLNATLPSNMYFLDGFSVGDDYLYPYEGQKADKSYTDDEYYFVHSGMFDIFNYTAQIRAKKPYLKENYLKAIDFRLKNKDLITKGKFKLLKTDNEKTFAYSIMNNDSELVVIGSLDDEKNQQTCIKSKYLKKINLFSLIHTKAYPQLNQDTIQVELEPLELQVYMINPVNSQVR